MGRYSNGINGGFKGTVGTVIGSNWKGIPYMRSKSAPKRNRKFTPAQINQQQKFGVAARFANTLTPLLDITFHTYAVHKTGRNSAISYLMKRAVVDYSPVYELDYSEVLVSHGDLLGAASAMAVANASGSIVFSWANNAGSGHAKASDQAIIVAHCPDLNRSLYAITAATRCSSTVSLGAGDFAGRMVHTWIGFISKNGNEVSDSVYTGVLVMP